MTATDTPRVFTHAVLALALCAGPALAQKTAANARAAQLLFDEAKRAADAGDYATACPKFVRSHQLDPAGGTILHAADCHEHEGKLATAWAEYNEALSFAVKAKRADRETIARARIEALAPKLAMLHLQLPPAARTRAGYTVWLDGTRLGDAKTVADVPVPVDAGTHVLEARAPSYLTATRNVAIADGQEQTVTFLPLRPDPSAPKDLPPPVLGAPARGRTQRIAGLALTGVGAAGLVVGGIFGIRALTIGDQQSRCTLGALHTGCPQSAVDGQNRARTSGTISTVGFVAGGVLAAGGLALYFSAPKAGPRRGAVRGMRVATAGLGASVSGEFW